MFKRKNTQDNNFNSEQNMVYQQNKKPIYCSEKVSYYEESCTLPETVLGMEAWGSIYYKQLYAALTEGKPMDVTLEQVRRQIMVIEECHKQNPLPKTVEI